MRLNDQDRFDYEVTRQEMEMMDETTAFEQALADPAWDVFINIRKVCMENGAIERYVAAYNDMIEVFENQGCEFDV